MGGTRTTIDQSSWDHIKQRNNSGIPVPNQGILLGDVSFEELELVSSRHMTLFTPGVEFLSVFTKKTAIIYFKNDILFDPLPPPCVI